jgi:hypothetical protein
VHGPHAPERGHRCNPSKLLLCPTPAPSTATWSGTRPCRGTTTRTARPTSPRGS